MEQYINKADIVAEIERIKKEECPVDLYEGRCKLFWFEQFLSFINSLEVKEVNIWHLQEKEDIYNAVKNWGLHTFVCIMKDGTIQKFSGCLDEDCEGHINAHIDGVNDNYDNVDDIVKWIEIV